MNIDYNAVIEILKSFLENEKTEILGISVGEERQVREAIKNLLTAYEKEKEKNKELNKYIEDRAKIGKNIQTFINKDYVEQEYISKDKIKAKIEEYKNKIKKIRNKKLINEPEDTINITRYVHYISVLQSLLEKE